MATSNPTANQPARLPAQLAPQPDDDGEKIKILLQRRDPGRG